MSGHRRYRRSRSSESSSWSTSQSSSENSSWSTWSSSESSSWSTSTTETGGDAPGGHWRLKRSYYASLPVLSWVLLNRAGARRDDFRRDRTTSAPSRTSKGEEISVSFELVEPPGTSVLTVDWPRASTTPRKCSSSGNVVAAHRDVVLLAMTSDQNTYPFDMFVYGATRDHPSRRGRPSLSLLPSAGGPVIYPHLLDTGEIGIMSCINNDDDSPSFVVAQLQMTHRKSNVVRLFRSGTGQWVSFQNLHVHDANGSRDLRWWTTDAVVSYGRRRCMIWVDYYRGMVLMDLSSWSATMNPPLPPPPPRLQYVPLPVDRVGDPEDIELGWRVCPKASRRLCVTRHGVKFVSVDTQHWSNFGVGSRGVLTWCHRFRITTWSLREDDDYTWTWRKDATMHEEEFWNAFDGGDRFPFPHVQPEFPVIDVDNPDVVVFRLSKPGRCHRDGTKWMIKVDLRKKVLLAATAYSYSMKKDTDGLSTDAAEDINSARMKSGFDPIPSELPWYLDGGQACKKRRQ